MPQIDFAHCDRITILKLFAIIEMAFSSILLLLYSYLCVLQDWSSKPDARNRILEYRWLIIFMTLCDFGLGSLLAYAANLVKKHQRPKVLLWIVFDTFLPPVTTFILRNMNYELEKSIPLSTDVHLRRTIFVHNVYTCIHFLFIMIVINCLAYYKPKLKNYDSSARSDSVFEPTDPKITTTESRYIRFSESLLRTNLRKEVEATTSTNVIYVNRNEFELHSTLSANFVQYKMVFLPFITTHWIKQLLDLLKPLKLEKTEEAKIGNISNQIQPTNPTICYLLATLYNFKKMATLKKQRR